MVVIKIQVTVLGGLGALVGYLFGGPYGAAIGYGIGQTVRLDLSGTQTGAALRGR
jgi:hypothetical protein